MELVFFTADPVNLSFFSQAYKGVVHCVRVAGHIFIQKALCTDCRDGGNWGPNKTRNVAPIAV